MKTHSEFVVDEVGNYVILVATMNPNTFGNFTLKIYEL